MKIGIIGAGHIGANVGKTFCRSRTRNRHCQFARRGNSADLVAELGEKAQAVEVEDAAKFGEIVFVSIPFGKYEELPAERFGGKIVIDSNNYYPDRDGNYPELDEDKTTSSELLGKHLRVRESSKALTRFGLSI